MSTAIWIVGTATAALGLIVLVLVVRRASSANAQELGSVSSQWIAEYRAGQPEDPAR